MKKTIIFIMTLAVFILNGSCINNERNNEMDINISDLFFESISLNDKYSAEQMLNSSNINYRDKYGATLLMKACGAMEYSNISEDLYDYDSALLLINKGADVTIKDNKGLSALDYAVKYAQTKFCVNDLIEILIDKGAPFNCDKASETISGYSIMDGDKTFYDYNVLKKISDKFNFSTIMPQEVWKSLKNENPDMNEITKLSDKDKIKILFNICAYSDVQKMQDYLKQTDLSDSVKDSYGNYLVHVSAMTGNTSVFTYLIDKFNINIINDSSVRFTPFQYAALNKHFDICRLWVDNKFPLTREDCESLYLCEDTELIKSVFTETKLSQDNLEKMLVNSKEYTTVEYLDAIINSGIDIDCINGDFTLLERACYLNYQDLVEYALKKGANPNGTAEKYSPIFYAVSNNNINMVKILIDKNANVTNCVKYNDGSKESLPLEIAKINKNDSIIRILEETLD